MAGWRVHIRYFKESDEELFQLVNNVPYYPPDAGQHSSSLEFSKADVEKAGVVTISSFF